MRLIVAGLIGALACTSREAPDSRAGSLEVKWIGSDTGKLSAPAVAEWCDGLKLLELRAVHGDTGIAIVLYPSKSVPPADSVERTGFGAQRDSVARRDSVGPADSITPGAYRVLAPERADSSRPAAAVALRWFAETSIRGFRGDSGVVVLETTAPGASAGRFSAHLRSATEGSRLNVTGSFKGLTVTPAPKSCLGRPDQGPDEPDEPDEPAESADSAETAD